jgi:hypothetical protein
VPCRTWQDCCLPARRSLCSYVRSLERRIEPTGWSPGTAIACASRSVSRPAQGTQAGGRRRSTGRRPPGRALVPHSSREQTGDVKKGRERPSNTCAGQEPDSRVAAGTLRDPWNTLKVETRVRPVGTRRADEFEPGTSALEGHGSSQVLPPRIVLATPDRRGRRTTFHVHMGAGDGAVLAHGLLTTERHRAVQEGTRRHRSTRRAAIHAWPQQP